VGGRRSPGGYDGCLKTYTSQFEHRKEFRMQYRLCDMMAHIAGSPTIGIPRFSNDGTSWLHRLLAPTSTTIEKLMPSCGRRLLEIAQLNRRAEAAILGASIAHEISQPLAAVITRASAGLRWLARKTPDVSQARAELSAMSAMDIA